MSSSPKLLDLILLLKDINRFLKVSLSIYFAIDNRSLSGSFSIKL